MKQKKSRYPTSFKTRGKTKTGQIFGISSGGRENRHTTGMRNEASSVWVMMAASERDMLEGQHVASHRTNFNTQNFPTGRHAARAHPLPSCHRKMVKMIAWRIGRRITQPMGLALGSISIIIEVRSPHMSTCCQLVKEVSERKRERGESEPLWDE